MSDFDFSSKVPGQADVASHQALECMDFSVFYVVLADLLRHPAAFLVGEISVIIKNKNFVGTVSVDKFLFKPFCFGLSHTCFNLFLTT